MENLAYLVFKESQNICREKQIAFTLPLNAQPFPGSELLITKTQTAYTNTTLMMSKLRPLWERGQFDENSDGLTTLTLIDRHGKPIDCELQIKQTVLLEWLEERIRQGLRNFFYALKAAFETQYQSLPDLIHILLAGNSSRSRIVLGFLGKLDDERSQNAKDLFVSDLENIFGENLPEFTIHLPLDEDSSNPYAATAKTGVALGLLRLCKGESLKVINHAMNNNCEDSQFRYYVGTYTGRKNEFSAAIKRGQPYGQWMELGVIRQGVFPLLYSSEPQVMRDGVKRGEAGLKEMDIHFTGAPAGSKAYAKIIAPAQLEVQAAISAEDVENSANQREIITLI